MQNFRWTFLLIFPFLTWGQAEISCHKKGNYSHGSDWLKSALANKRSDTADVINYRLDLDFTQISSNNFKAACQVKFEAKQNISSLSLDLLGFNIDSILQNGSSLSYSYDDTLLVCHLNNNLSPGMIDSLTVYYQGSPQLDPSGWGGFYNQSPYAYNLGVGFQSIPHNFGRAWHPCFDNFAERATYDFYVLTSQNKTAYCNGERVSVSSVGVDSLLTYWKMSDPIPSYLASFNVGNYTHVQQEYVSPFYNDTTELWLIAEPGDTTNMKSSFVNLGLNVEAFEFFFGKHEFNKVGFSLVPFSSGAMEHATNIAYPALVANGTLSYETLMAHEFGHHWWGDLVTCETAEEMWINEGMASYCERLFLEYVYGKENYMVEMRNNHKEVLHKAHLRDSGYYALNAVPLEFTYGDHSYNKGSDVAHTMRGYMGDTDFFDGLKGVIAAYKQGNLSSFQFRDTLVGMGYDVSDFFNDWIYNPGFSHFSVQNFEVTPSAGLYDIDVQVKQKLKAAPAYHNNVPLQLSFIDAQWNVHTEEIVMSGLSMDFSFSIPINPVYVDVNLDERISDATTGKTEVVTSTGLKDMNYANAKLTVQTITDSAWVRIRHNWVAPDYTSSGNIILSQERYWDVNTIDGQNMTGTLRFDFNGQDNLAGNLDNNLLVDYGGIAFHEDSVVLLYRPNTQTAWSEHPDYNLSTAGPNTDKKGFAIAQGVLDGQYTWGYKVDFVALEEQAQETWQVYPNPSKGLFTVDLTELNEANVKVQIFSIQGKLIMEQNLPNTKNQLELNLNPGHYILVLKSKESAMGSKRIIIE